MIDYEHKLNTLIKKGKEKDGWIEPNYLIVGVIGFLN